MIFNTRNTDYRLNIKLNELVSNLSEAEFTDPASKRFVEELAELSKIESRHIVYDICISQFASVKEHIERKEDISLPGLGKFKYLYYSEVRRRYMDQIAIERGYEFYVDIYNKELRNEIKLEAKRRAIKELTETGFFDKKEKQPKEKVKLDNPYKRTHAKVFTFSIPKK